MIGIVPVGGGGKGKGLGLGDAKVSAGIPAFTQYRKLPCEIFSHGEQAGGDGRCGKLDVGGLSLNDGSAGEDNIVSPSHADSHADASRGLDRAAADGPAAVGVKRHRLAIIFCINDLPARHDEIGRIRIHSIERVAGGQLPAFDVYGGGWLGVEGGFGGLYRRPVHRQRTAATGHIKH